MSDPAPIPVDQPKLWIDPSKLKAVVITILLALSATIAGATTIMASLKAHDLASVIAYIQSVPGLEFVTGATTLASFAALGWRTFWRKAREIYLGYHVRDEIAEITKPISPPSAS